MDDKKFLKFLNNLKQAECPHCPNSYICEEELCEEIYQHAKENLQNNQNLGEK